MTSLRSSSFAIASVCARGESSLTASKTVVRPAKTAAAISLTLCCSHSDARLSIGKGYAVRFTMVPTPPQERGGTGYPGYFTAETQRKRHPAVRILVVSSAALYFASGESLYLGAGLLLAACVVPRRWSLLRSTSSWLGLILLIVACPPVSWLTYAIFGSVFLLWLFTPAKRRSSSFAATGALIAVVLFISGSEWSHRQLPTINAPRDHHLVILGDSLSAGLGEATPWPTILERTTGVQVKNLACAGAGVRDALAMASQVTPEDHLVLLEIGGNDLLAGVPSREFASPLAESAIVVLIIAILVRGVVPIVAMLHVPIMVLVPVVAIVEMMPVVGPVPVTILAGVPVAAAADCRRRADVESVVRHGHGILCKGVSVEIEVAGGARGAGEGDGRTCKNGPADVCPRHCHSLSNPPGHVAGIPAVCHDDREVGCRKCTGAGCVVRPCPDKERPGCVRVTLRIKSQCARQRCSAIE